MKTLSDSRTKTKNSSKAETHKIKAINERLWANNEINVIHFTDRHILEEKTLRQSCCPVMA